MKPEQDAPGNVQVEEAATQGQSRKKESHMKRTILLLGLLLSRGLLLGEDAARPAVTNVILDLASGSFRGYVGWKPPTLISPDGKRKPVLEPKRRDAKDEERKPLFDPATGKTELMCQPGGAENEAFWRPVLCNEAVWGIGQLYNPDAGGVYPRPLRRAGKRIVLGFPRMGVAFIRAFSDDSMLAAYKYAPEAAIQGNRLRRLCGET